MLINTGTRNQRIVGIAIVALVVLLYALISLNSKGANNGISTDNPSSTCPPIHHQIVHATPSATDNTTNTTTVIHVYQSIEGLQFCKSKEYEWEKDREIETATKHTPDFPLCARYKKKRVIVERADNYAQDLNWFMAPGSFSCECGIECIVRNAPVDADPADIRVAGGKLHDYQISMAVNLEPSGGDLHKVNTHSISWQPDSTVPANYIEPPSHYCQLNAKPTFANKHTDYSGVSLIRNCAPWRNEWLQQLQQHLYLPIAHLGNCMRNADPATYAAGCGEGRVPWRQTKVCTVSKFKFYFAIENSRQANYVTEKFFQAIRSDAVVVYLGAPNIDEFSPGDNAFIDAGKFPSHAALADYLKSVAANETLYQSFFEWRNKPIREEFTQLYRETSLMTFPCRACEWISRNNLGVPSSPHA